MQFVRYPPLYSASSSYIMPQSFITSNVDLAATIFDITGIAKPNEYVLDGQSWFDDAKRIIDGTIVDNSCCNDRYIDIENSHSIMTENFQYIWRATGLRSSQSNRYFYAADREQLYNLTSDPNQQNNIISDASLFDIICEFRIKMIRYIRKVACTATICNEPDLGSCPTSSPTKNPTSSPTVPSVSPTAAPTALTASPSTSPTINTTCEWISNSYMMNFADTDESQVQEKIPLVKQKYARGHPCVEDEYFDFVFQTSYNERKNKLTIRIVACCGNSFDVMTDEQIPDGYARSSSSFNSMYEDDEEEALGVKEIVVLCLCGVIVIGLVLIGVYFYKKRKKTQAVKKEVETPINAGNETTDVEMPHITKMASESELK